MNRTFRFKKFIALVIVSAMILLISGCTTSGATTAPAGSSASTTKSSTTAGKTKTIGLSLPTKELARCLKDAEYMEKELGALGYKVIIQFAEGDPQLQSSQIENMITTGVDCLVISPMDSESLTTVVDTAHKNNIPVIAYDSLVLKTPYIEYYVTDNLTKVGELQGQYIVDKLGLSKGATGPFNLEIFAGDPADNNARFFYQGAIDAMKPYIDSGKLVVQSKQVDFNVSATPGWDGMKAQQRMDNLLSAHYTDKKVNAVLSNNDGLALGVISALKSVGYGSASKPFPVITGQDCDIANIKAIIAGEQTMTVFKDIRILAKKAALVVDSVLNNKPVTADDTKSFNNGEKIVPTLFVPPVALDVNNYKALLFDSGYYSTDLLK